MTRILKTPFVAIATAVAALAAIIALTPAGEARPRLGTVAGAEIKAATRIEVGQQAIHFYVNGEQVSMLDATGLHPVK